MGTDRSECCSDPPPPQAVLAALQALLANSALRLSERNRRFLSFVVGEALEGRGERIKAYTIGVDVFGRDDAFNPSSDPIVRIEATRLRAALAAYYEGAGAGDPVRILMPPGSYHPIFVRTAASGRFRNGQADGEASRNAVPLHRAAVVVKNQTDPRDRSAAAHGGLFIEAVVKRLGGAGLRVFVAPPPQWRVAARAVRDLLRHPDDVYALDIAVHVLAEGMRYSWCVTDMSDGRIRCTDFADRAEQGAPHAAVIDGLAVDAAQSIAGAIG